MASFRNCWRIGRSEVSGSVIALSGAGAGAGAGTDEAEVASTAGVVTLGVALALGVALEVLVREEPVGIVDLGGRR